MQYHDIYDDYPPPGETWWYEADGKLHVRASEDDPVELAYQQSLEHRFAPRPRGSLRAQLRRVF